MKFRSVLLLIACFGFMPFLRGQDVFYATDKVQEIRIYFEQDNWDEILDELYVNGEEERLEGAVTLNGRRFEQVGIRYKGFSSVSTDRAKNPFNIKLNYVIEGQEYDGIDKIKLSNVIQDPSFIREALSYEIAGHYMPVSKANFATVYVNDVYWGLYTNVEAVDKDFLSNHFTSDNNALFKCNPEELDLDADGENSNLNKTYEDNIADYEPYYDLKSDDGWDELQELIEILNESADDIESILNVDRTLWMHAFNYTLVNFDSYIGYAQNYYLYQDDGGRFNPILWDLNMSFASYRFSDASEYYDGFSIDQAKTIDPLSHYSNVSVAPRPLLRNLFENDTYRKMYLAHIRTIVKENFSNGNYYDRGQALQTLIDSEVKEDENKFYTYSDFKKNLDSTTSDLIDYPGIKDLMEARTAYLTEYLADPPPSFSDFKAPSDQLSIGDSRVVNVEVSEASSVVLAYRYGKNGAFTKLSMLDDGAHEDGAANDNVYGVTFTVSGTGLQYYFYAENDKAGAFLPERAAYEFYQQDVNIAPMGIVINELMAAQHTVRSDGDEEFEDWIELYNNTDIEINLGGLYLSDDEDELDKWSFPDKTMAPNTYLIVWADGETGEEKFHTNFGLDDAGDELYISNTDGSIIDSLSFDSQYVNISTGRSPNITGDFIEMNPSFLQANYTITDPIEEEAFSLFPNPATDRIQFIADNPSTIDFALVSPSGHVLKTRQIPAHKGLNTIDISDVSAGVYLIQLSNNETSITHRLIKY